MQGFICTVYQYRIWHETKILYDTHILQAILQFFHVIRIFIIAELYLQLISSETIYYKPTSLFLPKTYYDIFFTSSGLYPIHINTKNRDEIQRNPQCELVYHRRLHYNQLKEQKMSALLPQSKSVLTIDYMNPVFAILKKLEQQNIISILALALKKNIQNFCFAAHNIQEVNPKAESLSRKETVDELCQKNIIEISSNQEVSSHKQVIYRSKTDTSAIKGPVNTSKIQKTLQQFPTSSQNHLQLAESNRKVKIIKKQVRDKPSSPRIILPQIDLISTVQLRNCKLTRTQFKQLKTDLLSRRVQSWASKSKLEKRQIRMLGN